MIPHQTEMDISLLTRTVNAVAMVTTAKMLDEGWRFDEAARVVSALMPSISDCITDMLPTSSTVLVTRPALTVTAYPDETAARAAGEGLQRQGVAFVGFNMGVVLSTYANVIGTAKHERDHATQH